MNFVVLSFEYWLLLRKPRHSAILLSLVFITPPALSCFVSLHAVLFVACFPVCLFHYGFVSHALRLLFFVRVACFKFVVLVCFACSCCWCVAGHVPCLGVTCLLVVCSLRRVVVHVKRLILGWGYLW